MKKWPNRLLTAGITCTIIGTVILIAGIVLTAIGVNNSTITNWSDWGDQINDTGLGGIALIILSVGLFLAEGIACWIVGGIFKHKYSKNHKQK
ncbi:MAG: hypothetical protein LBM72_01655 [Mycoplasmataceae bacterium]|jgi:hypothetical protein|nr:hypothetical protein [Mycoplasmataceae bacterium]